MSKAKELFCEAIRIVKEDEDPVRFAQIVVELCELPVMEIPHSVITGMVIAACYAERKYGRAHNQISSKSLSARYLKEKEMDIRPSYNEMGVMIIPEDFRQDLKDFQTWAESKKESEKQCSS